VCAIISTLFIFTGFPLLTQTQPITKTQLTESCVIRQFTGYDSGVKEEEYYLLLTQEETDNFIVKKENELKHSLPITTAPKISSNEICLFVFIEEHFRGKVIVNAVEEYTEIVCRVKVESGQTIDFIDSKGNTTKHCGPEFDGSGETPFGYFILPKTNKEVVIQRNTALYKGEEKWLTVKEFTPK